ncbi:MAG: copper chaperone PCu(A)C [Chloroflexota bacterium]
MKSKLAFVLLLTIFLLSACGTTGEFKVMDAWARPAASGENGAVYFIISNATDTDDILLSASTDVASAAEVHMSMMDDNGVMSMQMQGSVQVSSGESVTFKPGGLHIMLIGLNRELKVGDTFILTLQFEKAGEIAVQVEVREQ